MAFSVAGQRVVVVGAARSGVAAAELLTRRGARVTLTDRKQEIDAAEGLADRGIALELGGHRMATLTSADLVVVSPGVPLEQPAMRAAREAGVPIIGELELASRWVQGRVIAITGTKGKSTTTALTGRMLEASGFRVKVGGNIGVPLSDQIEDSTPETLHVVEVSSFQLETTDTFHPWIAALLNFSPDHLDQHSSLEAYAAAKARIFRRQTAKDWAVVNEDDVAALKLASDVAARRVPYGLGLGGDGYTVVEGAIVERRLREVTQLVPVSAVKVPGQHILSDVLAATAISRTAGADTGAIAAAVAGFEGLEHAMEVVATVDGVRFMNDSKATNVESARRSIESVGPGVVAILGGRYKGGEFADLLPALEARHGAVVAIGEAADRIEAALSPRVMVTRATSMRDAVRAAYARTSPGATVVLAPACSSFDMFRDYADRGRRFKEEVQALAAERRTRT